MTKHEVLSNQKKLSSIAKEHRSLEKVVKVAKQYISLLNQIDEDKEMLKQDDANAKAIAKLTFLEADFLKFIIILKCGV